jgi:magnesium transporter
VNAEEQVATAFLGDHPDEAARILEHLNPADAAELLGGRPAHAAAAVFRVLGPVPASTCAAAMPDDALAAIIDELPLDDAGAALRGVEKARHEAILQLVAEEKRAHLQRALAWDDDTAGSLADPLVLSLTDDLSVAEAQRQLRGSRQHLIYYVYVVDRAGLLLGVLAVQDLMAARPRAVLRDVMQENPVRLDAGADLATVAAHPAWRDFDALPVVDARGHLVGAIRHKTVRRLGWTPGRPFTETLVRLSEAYWAGMSGMLASLAPYRSATPATGESDHGS